MSENAQFFDTGIPLEKFCIFLGSAPKKRIFSKKCTNYYPFGLTMAGLQDQALKTNYSENKYRYDQGNEMQNKEFGDGTGLELYETSFRSFDPQLGRFAQIDPLSEKSNYFSVYQYGANNPVLENDPSGLRAVPPNMSSAQLSAWVAGICASFSLNDVGSAGDGGGGGGGGGGMQYGDYSVAWANILNTLFAGGWGSTWTNDGSGDGTGNFNFTNPTVGEQTPGLYLNGSASAVGSFVSLVNQTLTGFFQLEQNSNGSWSLNGYADPGTGVMTGQQQSFYNVINDATHSCNALTLNLVDNNDNFSHCIAVGDNGQSVNTVCPGQYYIDMSDIMQFSSTPGCILSPAGALAHEVEEALQIYSNGLDAYSAHNMGIRMESAVNQTGSLGATCDLDGNLTGICTVPVTANNYGQVNVQISFSHGDIVPNGIIIMPDQ